MKKIISIFAIILILMSTICFATTQNADEPMLINETTLLEEKENVLGDNFILEDKDYKISNQTINGNTFVMVAKECVIENVTINGNLFIISDSLEIVNSNITSSAFILGKNIKISNSEISDIYLLGNNINLKEKTIINREAKILGDTIEVSSTVNGNAYISGSKVEIKDLAQLNGNTKVEYGKEYVQDEKAIIKNIEIHEQTKNENPEMARKNNIKSKLLDWVSVLIKTSIIIGIIFLFGYDKFEKFVIRSKKGTKIATLSLKGFLWLIIIPIMSVILIVFSFGLLAGLSVLALALYAIFIYMAFPIVSLFIALIIKHKYIKNNSKLEFFGIILITASALWILGKFPILGILVNFVILNLGLGIIVEYIVRGKKIIKEEVVIIDNK